VSGYTELGELGVVFRPPATPLPPSLGVSSPFSASWTSTVELLADELRHLDAKRIAVELALTESDLRIDGMPRANARLSADAVRIAFDSKYGPLMYETGRFTGSYWRGSLLGWQVNLRAVALGLEALRKVDRYGITKRGEQYTGWKQLPASTSAEGAIQTREQALYVLSDATGATFDPTNREHLERAAREAQKRSHPDVPGGSDEKFRKVQRAREVLGV
jgi:hypothetical protein